MVRGADHRVSAGSRQRGRAEGFGSQARVLRGGYYLWRSKYGGMDVSDAKRLKALEVENARLKRLLTDAMLENAVTKEAPRRKW